MIQDIKPHSFDNQFHEGKKVKPNDFLLVFDGDEVLLCKENHPTLSVPKAGMFNFENSCEKNPGNNKSDDSKPDSKSLNNNPDGKKSYGEPCDTDAPIYLFNMDGQDFYLATGSLARRLIKGLSKSALRRDIMLTDEAFNDESPFIMISPVRLRKHQLLERHLIFALLTALHLSRWYGENIYCGHCATKTFYAPDERALVCPKCNRRIYPKIMPAVIVGVINGDKIALTKYADRPVTSYALVAGFNEIGETFEDTVRREVMEELGLKVKNIRYYKSQPWAIAGDILAGYYCDVDGDSEIHIDHKELKEGTWFKREDVIGQPDDFSLTNEMMMTFKEGKEPKGNVV